MNFGPKYNTIIKRAREGMTLWDSCKGRGSPNYFSASQRLKRNSDGISDIYAAAVNEYRATAYGGQTPPTQR